MQITADTHDLKPPRPGRWLGPVGLALVAHALLMGALTWGVHWQKDEPLVSFEAELWSSVPREAAPRAVQPPPPPPPEPEARPEPKPEPKPEPRPAPPPPPAVKQADIATAQAKKKVEAEKREQEQAKKADARRKAEALEKEKEKEAKQKAAEKLAQEKKDKEKRLAEQKRKDDARKAAEEERSLQAQREANIRRMMGQVGASGSPDARGSAARSSGPSSGYGNRVRERIRPNIRYSEEFPRKLLAEIEVRTLADGTITSRRLLKSSGNAAWDDAALRAIDRTGSLPRDVDGRVPSPMIVEMRPLD
ncbi:MAG: cell envelope integrity protein TolA [Hydrogenophaga sp.]|nr:cell envelope integrity protein TolA [Hydrogenophaga sp.]